MPTLFEMHQEIVKKLLKRGEPVFKPFEAAVIKDLLDVYAKAHKFGTKKWVSGHAALNDDGTYNILEDAQADLVGKGPFKLEELGLCDPKCRYANEDPKTYPQYYPPPIEPKVKKCPHCGRPMEEQK